ncbi:MAG: porin family protein [Longimicrobiales bacterium]
MRRFSVVLPFITVLAALAAPAAAQSLELGIKAGPTFSKVSVDDDEGADFGNRTAFAAGAFLRVPLGSVAFQPEVLYVNKGTVVTDPDFGDGELKVAFSYIEIPLLIQVPFGTGIGPAPYIFGGPSLAFETGCTFGLEGEGVSLDIDCDEGEEEDLELQRKKFDYGAVFGAGLRVPAGSGAFLIEGRYTLGLANLDDSPQDDSIKNRSAAVLVGYSFVIGS